MDRGNHPKASNQTRETMDKQTTYDKTLQLYLESEFAFYSGLLTNTDANNWRLLSQKYQGYRNAMLDVEMLTWEDVAKIEKHKVKIEKPE
jgi:hypothetical protein